MVAVALLAFAKLAATMSSCVKFPGCYVVAKVF